jgi:hypothetical protein
MSFIITEYKLQTKRKENWRERIFYRWRFNSLFPLKTKTVLWERKNFNPLEEESKVYQPKSWSELTWVKNFEEFCEYIKEKGLPNHICFEKDSPSRQWLIKYCLENKLKIPNFTE